MYVLDTKFYLWHEFYFLHLEYLEINVLQFCHDAIVLNVFFVAVKTVSFNFFVIFPSRWFE